MKSKIVKIISAIILISMVFSVLDHIFIPKYVDENQDGCITREFYDEKTKLNVMGLGSSTMYNAMSPVYLWEKYGITGYVRSNASQTLWQSYYLLEDAIKYNRPELVVLDMSFIKYGEEFIEEPSNRKTIEGMKNPFAKLGAIESSKYSEEQPLSYYLPVLRYHSRYKELTAEDVKYAYNRPTVTYDGFLMDFSIPEEQNIYEPGAAEETEFPEKSMKYLNKIMDLCEKENIQLLLMKTPTFVNSWHSEYDDMIEKIANERNLTYINFDAYADTMDLDVRRDYVDDGSHLNLVGAHKFCDVLGDVITNKYNLSDNSGDKELVAIWNDKASKYDEAVSKGMKEYEETKDELGL